MPCAEIAALPAPARLLVETCCLHDTTRYVVPERGFTRIDLSLFLEQSERPNVASVDEGQQFEAIRDIAAGEELLIDYGTIVDDA